MWQDEGQRGVNAPREGKSLLDLENKVKPESSQLGLMTNSHHWWFRGTCLGIKVSVGAVLRSPLIGTGI